jgi:hypothetical protein
MHTTGKMPCFINFPITDNPMHRLNYTSKADFPLFQV